MSSNRNNKLNVLIMLVACFVISSALIGKPKSATNTISQTKKLKNYIDLSLPVKTLSGSLSVNACDISKKIYDNPQDFKLASSGLKVFQARLKKEESSGSLGNLVSRIFLHQLDSDSSTNTCLPEFSILAPKKISKEIKDADLLEVSLADQSVFCSESKPYLYSEKSDSFFPLRESIAGFSSELSDKKVVQELKRRQEKAKSSKPRNSKEKAHNEKALREISHAIKYAQFIIKDGEKLSSFFDAVCNYAANPAPQINPTADPEEKLPTPLATATSINTPIPTATAATPTATRIPTVTNIPTATRTNVPTNTSIPINTATKVPTSTSTAAPIRIASPEILQSGGSLPSGTDQITISWSKVEYASGQARYLVRAIDTANPSVSILDENIPADNYRSESITIKNLQSGKNYRFWVHAATADYNYANQNTWSVSDDLFFSVLAGSATATPVITTTPVTPLPTLPPGTGTKIRIGSAQLLINQFDLNTQYDASAPTLKVSATEFYTWMQNGDYSFKKFLGTLDNPFKTLLWSSTTARWDDNGFPKEPRKNEVSYNYRPWMANVYKHTDGTLIGFVHIETDIYDKTSCRYRQGIAISADNGDNWKYLGDVIKPQNDNFSNLGGIPLLIVGEYFYQYFNEVPLNGPRIPAVARAKISEVIAAAKQGTVSNWKKYNNGNWNQDALTGVGSNILPSPDRYDMHADAVYSTALGKYILVAWEQAGWDYGTITKSDANKGLYIYTSTDGVNWGNRIKAYTPTGRGKDGAINEENPYSFFSGLEPGSSDDFNVLAGNFYLNFPDRVNHKFYRLPIIIE